MSRSWVPEPRDAGDASDPTEDAVSDAQLDVRTELELRATILRCTG